VVYGSVVSSPDSCLDVRHTLTSEYICQTAFDRLWSSPIDSVFWRSVVGSPSRVRIRSPAKNWFQCFSSVKECFSLRCLP